MNHSRLRRLALPPLLTLLLAPGPLRSQGDAPRTGTISGTVVNAATREALASVNVRVVGTRLGAVTDSTGGFVIRRVPAGEYAVRASLVGFLTVTRSDVMVTPVRPAVIRIELGEAPVELEGVGSAAGYFPATPDMPTSASRQSSEEIRRQPGGFEDVLRAVSILPGVARPEPGRNDLIVRGGAPSENLYLLDGIEIPNINHFGTQGSGGGPLSYINLDFVDNTLFSAGGFGPRYGDRLSSVLGIELREGRTDRIGGKLTLAATQFGASVEGPAPHGGSFLFSARRSYLDFIFKGAGFGFVPEYWDFLLKWRYAPRPSDEVRVIAVGAIDDVNFFNDTGEQRYDNSRILGNSQRQIAGGTGWRRLLGSGYFSVTFAQAWTDFTLIQRDTLRNPVFTNESIEYESSLRGDLLIRVAPFTTLSAGIAGKLVRFSNDIELPGFVTPFGDTLRGAVHSGKTGAKAGAYAQLSREFGRLNVSAGIRQDYFSLIDAVPPPEPRFSASFALTAAATISASVGRYGQSPSYVWLAAHPGNRSLRYIRADQAVLGLAQTLRADTRIVIEGYLKRYAGYPASVEQPYLVLSNTGAGFGGSEDSYASFGLEPLVSEGSGSSEGVEISIRKNLSELPFHGYFSLSAGRTRYRALDGVERPSSFDQRLILNAGGGYVIGPLWEVGARFRLATGRPTTPFNADGTKSTERYNGARLGVDHSLDVRVDRRWFFDSWTMVAYIDIQNVYNRKPSRAPRFDARTGTLEEEDSIGILPSIGISAEF